MSYVVLARKFRPQRFEDLVGQDHIARTLSNAIDSGRVAHAFLFTGVRGIGKTTSARILAKALNCMGDPDSTPAGVDSGPTAQPCLRCPACREITAGTDVDVREIDGASYTGVDEVRKLQDSLPYRPARDRYKIIIVDEVHMLSQNAWNAFLKTLEEPPAHVKFIFATTEVHKVPVTILSRVQRFDFKLIPTRLIMDRLREVLRAEQVEADDSALSVIAREAAGSMRDAMSLLDQVIAWESSRLCGDDVARVLGVASRQVLHDVARAVVGGEPGACLSIVAQLAEQGYDMPHVARDLLALLRDLVVAKVCEEPGELLDLPDEEQRDVRSLAQATDADDLLRLHQGFSHGFDDVVRSGQPRAALEMLLVRLSRRPPLIPIDDLVGRLGALERRLAGGGQHSSGSGSAGGRSRSGKAPAGRRERDASASRRATSQERAGADAPPKATPTEAGPTERVLLACWRGILDDVRKERPDLAAYLEHAVPLQLDEHGVRLAWSNGRVFSEQVSTPESRRTLERVVQRRLEAEPSIEFEFESSSAKGGLTVAAENAADRERELREAQERVRRDAHVTLAVDVLGARIKEIRLAD